MLKVWGVRVIDDPVLLETDISTVIKVPMIVTEFWTVSVDTYCQMRSIETLLVK